MPLLGEAAMLLAFDVEQEAIAEHDHWHTHEHFPERLSIPGFLRGTRWVAPAGSPRYCVLYDVESLATLTSAAYLARLEAPTPWTAQMMRRYRGMARGFCAVRGSFGLGVGGFARVVRFRPPEGEGADLRRRLLEEALPALPSRPGIAGAHLLEGAATPPMTREQRIRGADRGVDWAIVLTGYDAEALAEALRAGPAADALARHGARDVASAAYRLDYALARDELAVRR